MGHDKGEGRMGFCVFAGCQADLDVEKHDGNDGNNGWTAISLKRIVMGEEM